MNLVITDNPDNIVNITNLGRLGKSYHSCYADFHSIRYEMSLIPWQNILEGLNTEESWKFFKDNLNALTEKYGQTSY